MILKAAIVLVSGFVLLLTMLYSVLRIISGINASDITHLRVNFRKTELEIKKDTKTGKQDHKSGKRDSSK